MKRIIRLTESDLARIVRRVISEGNGENAIKSITKAMSGLGTDERAIQRAVYSIKNKADYEEALAAVKKLGYKTIGAYISTDMEYVPYGSNIGGLYDEQNDIVDEVERHLGQFNSSEKVSSADTKGTSYGRTDKSPKNKPFKDIN